MPSPEQQAWIDQYGAPAAVDSERSTGLPGELTLAQAIIESQYGQHAPGFNCFGIKAAGRPKSQLLSTSEWFTPEQAVAFVRRGCGRVATLRTPAQSDDQGKSLYDCKDLFAAYDSLAECFSDHARLITHGVPYARTWAQYQNDHNFDALIAGVCGIYATDPGYTKKIQAAAHSPTVAAAIQEARRRRALNAT